MAVRTNFKTITRKFSALYITGDKAQSNFVVLTPHIDFTEKIDRKSDLIQSIEARKLTIDFEQIQKRWNFFKMINDHKEVLEVTRSEILKLINTLKEDAEKNKGDIERLYLHLKLIKNDLKNVKEYSYGVEENANLGVLSLPNYLHSRTPLNDESKIHESLLKPEIIDKSHMEIGISQNLLEYKNPTFYFLKSEASLFEFALTNYFQNKLLETGFVQFSNADFARSVVVEGCGADHLDQRKSFIIEGENDELNRLHLVGGGSLCSFMAYFAKNSIQTAFLPIKAFSIGRKYIPVEKGNDLFSLSQNTVARIFVATEDDTIKMDEALDALTQNLISMYETLGYHFRVVYVPANELEKEETLRVSLQMFSNFSQNYVEVSNLSVYDSYLSERLLFCYNMKKERKFLKVISGEVMNVQRFLACAIENNSFYNKPLLNDVLKQFLE